MPSFLDFPPEIRRMIYLHCMNPNEYKNAYDIYRHNHIEVGNIEYRKRGPLCIEPRIYITRTTPSILLLNKQITAEALEVLYRIPVDLYGTPGSHCSMRQMDIAEFICEQFLQRIQYAALLLGNPHKNFVLQLLDIWGADNRLKRLDVYFPKGALGSYRHWDIVESRLRTFSLMVPVHFHEVPEPSEAPSGQ